MLEIVDAHHHFWDPARNYHPWLRDEPPIPFRYGDYNAIRRRYLHEQYLADAHDYAVAGSVYVETEWDPRDPIGEMTYVAELRQKGLPSVAVGQAWLDRGRCREGAGTSQWLRFRAQRPPQAPAG